MSTKNWRALTYLPWLSLPLVLISNLILWNRLPANLAVHFNLGGAANGWMSREWNLAFSLGALFLILSFSTAPLLRERREGAVMRAKDLLRHCLSVVIISGIMIGVLIYNLQ